MADKFLTTFGAIFGGRTLAYGRIDKTRLPNEVGALLQSYKQVVIVLCIAVGLPLFFRRPLTLLIAVPLAAFCFILKQKFEKKLDPLLAPYMKRGEE